MHLGTGCGIIVFILITVCAGVKSQLDDSQMTTTSCTSNYDCKNILHSVCSVDNSCTCIASYVAVADKQKIINCHKLADKLDDPCLYKEQCFGIGSTCEHNKCICSPGYIFYPDNLNCYKGNLKSYSCSSYVDCGGGICDMGHCICGRKQSLHENNGTIQCLNAPEKLGYSCKENLQCSENFLNTECKNFTCVCKPGLHKCTSIKEPYSTTCDPSCECVKPDIFDQKTGKCYKPTQWLLICGFIIATISIVCFIDYCMHYRMFQKVVSKLPSPKISKSPPTTISTV